MEAQMSRGLQTLKNVSRKEKPSSKRSKRIKASHGQDISVKDEEIRDHDQDYSHIETLPRELIWMILEYAPAVVLELSKVSNINILKKE